MITSDFNYQLCPKLYGYVDIENILQSLPEHKAANSEYESLQRQLSNRIKVKLEEFQQVVRAAVQQVESSTGEIEDHKKLEIQKLQDSIEKLKSESQKKLSRKQNDLFKPIYEKVQHAIKCVAEEHGYTYVLNANGMMGSAPVLLYADEVHDLSDLALKQLGTGPAQASE